VSFDEETMLANGCELADLESTGTSVDQVLHQQDARRLINGALDQLPEEFREVIVLRNLKTCRTRKSQQSRRFRSAQ